MHYQDTPETTAQLDWADLVTLDLSEFDQPGGKQRLATQLKDAIHHVGFFYITNFGLSEDENDKQFTLAAEIFNLADEEKAKYNVDHSLPGGPLGYKPKGSRPIAKTGLRDNTELYDDPKYNALFQGRPRPPPCIRSAAQTEYFCRHLHTHVLYRLLVLTAIILELEDQEALWKLHNYDEMSNCHMRYMIQHPRSPEEMKIVTAKGVEEVIYGHTDFGTFTLLFRQPVAALQIRADAEEEWKWVKPLKHSITVNVADTLSFLTGGYLKSSIHRVVLPPPDQRHIPRLSVIYFSRPDDETILRAVDSPLIAREGNTSRLPPDNAVTAGDWVRARYGNIGNNYSSGKDSGTVISNVEVAASA